MTSGLVSRMAWAPPTTPAQYAAYPIIQLADLQSLQFGANDPQRNLQDTYQILDNQTKLFGRHTLKYGAEFRHYIAPSFFLSRSTGKLLLQQHRSVHS